MATKQVKRIGAALARHQGSDERVEQVSRMVAILIIFCPLQSRNNLDENVVRQREVVGNVDDDTDEELLKQVGSSFFYPCLKFN